MSSKNTLPSTVPSNGLAKKAPSVLSRLAKRFVPDENEQDISHSSIRLVWFSAAAIFILLVWAGFAELDQIARGIGQIVPSQRVQLIQNLEGGIVQDILVHEGQVVEKNAVVMRIDNETADSQYR